ncbi:MAG: aldo/keto reductase [Coriobacteriia bacterium]|nr:aldo/keto reductase [Coriobacteriia bacterium]
MKKVRFGKTGLMVSRVAFGGIPIQRISVPDAVGVVRKAIDLGVNFIDTANGYGDSEEKIGLAIKDTPRADLVLASKSMARDKKTLAEHIDLSLMRLGVDYLDLYQLHNVSTPQGREAAFAEGGAYEALTEAVAAGKVRFLGFSSHNIPLAMRIMQEIDFSTVQLPFNYVDDSAANEAIPLAEELDMGFIAMKPFGGGLLSDAGLSIKYLLQFDSIVPDPGIERLTEIEEIVRVVESVESGEGLTAVDRAAIDKVREEMGDRWCHRCDYCQPCPAKVGISTVLTVESFIRRMSYDGIITLARQGIETGRNCVECRACVSRCPYKLDIPKLIKEKMDIWDRYLAEHK